MKRNPVEITEQLKDGYASYIASEYKVDDPRYQEQITRELKTVDLFKGPYIKVEEPFEKEDSIRSLVEQGILHPNFLKLTEIPFDRPLYAHQKQAIIKALKGNNLIVTTGTGSGKTESFLFPILNYILTVKDRDKSNGVKALLLYPMNALVNDQIDRISEILKNYPEISFGKFIGDTKEKLSESERIDGNFPDNERADRTELRKNPPDILITNYSMLEYLLIRPEDSQIINPSTLQNWQFLVLDEAHTYSGTKGTEISYLLRRLEGFAERKPQYLLTSATLGDVDTVNDITRFGHNLTNSNFGKDDVVFASRKHLDIKKMVRQNNPNIYPKIREVFESGADLAPLLYDYIYDRSKTAEENLFNYLSFENNVGKLFSVSQETETFESVLEKMEGFSSQQLVDLIYLICIAKTDNNDFLFDIKYHYFITSPNRAFITLSNSKKIKFGNYEEIDGEKAFEIGRCRNCDHLYIIGKISKGYLNSADSIDVYENYEDYGNRKELDVFSLTKDEDDMEDYLLCPHCGRVKAVSNPNEIESICKHDDADYIHLYKAKRPEKSKKNNLTVCPHCGQRNNVSGMLHSFRIDQDRATSVITQIYLDAISDGPSPEPEKIAECDVFEESEINLFDDSTTTTISEKQIRNKRQLLAFSDGRQKASYFAVRLQRLYTNLLRRNIVLDVLQNKPEIPLKSLANQMKELIISRDLFDEEPQAEAWKGILTDLFILDGNASPESLGLYLIQYNLNPISSFLDKSKSSIQKYFGLSVEEFKNLLQFVALWLRKKQAVDYTCSELTKEDVKDLFEYSDRRIYITPQKEPGKKSETYDLISFYPMNKNRDNNLTNYLRKLYPGAQDVERYLKPLLNFLTNSKLNILTPAKESDKTRLQLKAENFLAVRGDKVNWYRCRKCGNITAINIHDVCVVNGCDGQLEPFNPDKELADSFYRKRYQMIAQEKMTVKEHTAQLAREKAKAYQNEFKEQKINVLSCSTTFEVGVDIGSLENVFMRNVPPSPANYVQRAGRAGRGKDSSALIVTYCLNRSHDYSFFEDPKPMVDGIVKPPLFTIANQKIALRHITASALGFYFRKYQSDYHDPEFIFVEGMERFLDYLKSKPSDLNAFINKYILSDSGLDNFDDFGWLDPLLEENSEDTGNGKLAGFIRESLQLYRDYEDAIKNAIQMDQYDLLSQLNKGIKALLASPMITLLSDGTVIPKYGFPVDVVQLRTMDSDTEIDLSRDLKIALSEYAPDSEVVADGKKYISRYLNIPKLGGLQVRYYYTCPECQATTTSIFPFEKEEMCPNCGYVNSTSGNSFVIPRFGFTAEWGSKKANQKPKKTYSGQTRYISGQSDTLDTIVHFNNKVSISLIRGGTLAVLNENSFYYCPECGFTLRSKKQKNLPEYIKEHDTQYHQTCSNKKLKRTALGYTYKTDVVKLSLSVSNEVLKSKQYDEVLTTAFAILEGMSRELQIDRNDINTTVIFNRAGNPEILLFDDVPGGAGYVKQLLDKDIFKRVLERGLRIVDQTCCDENTSCNSCLRNYYNQAFHKQLKRRLARDLIRRILEESKE